MTTSPIFVFHTLQHGYPLNAALGKFLGEPVGRYRTVQPYPLAVYRLARCENTRCGFEHRVCGLLNRPGEGHRVEGDLFELDDEQLRLLDIEEYYLPDQPDKEQGSVRRVIELEPNEGGAPVRAETHFNDPHKEHYTQALGEDWAELLRPIIEVRAEYIEASLAAVREDWGDFEGYLERGLGISEAERDAIRKHLLD